ncbi:MAG: bifunctional aspartate kinase/homoserine dehydrogenase I [Bacteroidales bacterium]|nr:bifunctional aspartate kinase/homoserine dehydrogenase I [Bacteroidales bacterium]
MQVLKFGGTSVASAENMSKVVDIVVKALEKDRTILVCSAISKCTDTLIEVGKRAASRDESYKSLLDALQERHHGIIAELVPESGRDAATEVCDGQFESLKAIVYGVYLVGELSSSSLDAIQSYGELLSTRIIQARFKSLGISCKWVDSRTIVKTDPNKDRTQDNEFTKNVVDMDKTRANFRDMLEKNDLTSLFIIQGFIASDSQGHTTTLGRGGSDYTASIAAVCTKARTLEIWTDVTGMMTSNPKVVPNALTIEHISYRAALELSHFGAKVIYPPTIQPVVSEGIPIRVKNTFNPDAPGTLIEQNPPRSSGNVIGLSNSDNIALISLEGSGMVGIPGFSSRLFDALSRNDINIILITQASSVHTMCIAVSEKDAIKAKKAADDCFAYEISLGKLNPLKVETGFSIICLVGDDVLTQSGATGRMLTALGKHAIPVRATAQGSSERNISVIVPSSLVDKALRYVHDEFFDDATEKIINIYVAGYGTVGKALLDIIAENGDNIAARTGKRIRVCGLANSRRYLFDIDGLKLENLKERLAQGEDASEGKYFELLGHLTQEDSVFVDCTANGEMACRYLDLFARGYHVVACNKIPLAAPYPQYLKLNETALAHHCRYRYGTTVGAALPVLESVARCTNSGDPIHKVQAVLSGTLNFIFSTYKGAEGPTFSEVVRLAQQKGYSEPDPRIDLSGKDVLRKLVILSRESGLRIEESDVKINPILGPEYFEGDVEAFFQKLSDNEDYFRDLFESAASRGRRLRFVASLDGTDAAIGLCEVGPENALYNLMGSDNAAIITTDYYPSPLVIQGAGAGALQTASGVLKDILL